MPRPFGLVCAGALLLAAVGCTMDSFYLTLTGSQRNESPVAGSITMVKDTLKAALQARQCKGVHEVANGEEIRVTGMTPSGKKFDFILQRQKTPYGEQTLVALEGEREAQEFLWQGVMLTMTAPHMPAGPQPGPSQGVWPPDMQPPQQPIQQTGGIR